MAKNTFNEDGIYYSFLVYLSDTGKQFTLNIFEIRYKCSAVVQLSSARVVE